MADVKAPTHLSELFHSGEEVDIEVFNEHDPDNPLKFPVWIRRPTVGQQEECRAKANAKQHRRKRQFKDKEGDAWLGMWETSVDPLTSKTEVVEAIVSYDESRLKSQAYNEVLFGDTGSDWGTDGQGLLNALEAVQQRIDEIGRLNDALDEEDSDLAISFSEDEELLGLQADYDRFVDEQEARFQELREAYVREFDGMTMDQLRRKLTKKIVELEGDMAWYAEYKMRMLYHAVRKVDSHNDHYFGSLEDILELPGHVQTQLMAALDNIDRGGDAKNSDSLLESLA